MIVTNGKFERAKAQKIYQRKFEKTAKKLPIAACMGHSGCVEALFFGAVVSS